MKRSGFSMIELVFVIVILGVLAAVAVPRFVTTRTDAQVAMARSDIASTMKAIPARIFAENIDPTQATPTGFSNWGEWMIDTAGLDRGRWQLAQHVTGLNGVSQNNAIAPIGNQRASGSGNNQVGGCGGIIGINITDGTLIFNPFNINTSDPSNKTFCDALKASYPSGSNRVIPLATTGAVKF